MAYTHTHTQAKHTQWKVISICNYCKKNNNKSNNKLTISTGI